MEYLPNRRTVLVAAAVAGAAGVTGSISRRVAYAAESGGVEPLRRGTTLDSTLTLGPAGPGGYRRVKSGPGEPHAVRTELASAGAGRSKTRRGLFSFAQLTDMHLIDSQSPARLEFLDRYNDPGELFRSWLPVDAAYRAQDMLTLQVAESMVQAIARVGAGPVTGTPIGFSIVTGDTADTMQHNELRWYIDLLDGRTVCPDSGDRSRYEGVADDASYDIHYWHPHGAPRGVVADKPTEQYGFPQVPGLLDAVRRPFQATGLQHPWYTAYGNHDGLWQGNVPLFSELDSIATGSRKVVGLHTETDIRQIIKLIESADTEGWKALLTGPYRTVTPDPQRRLVTRKEVIAAHFDTAGSPRGHGYTAANQAAGTAYYGFDHGAARCLVLDTVNPYGGADGSVDATQFNWLEQQLIAVSSRYRDSSGKWVTTRNTDRLVIIFSHHTTATLGNTFAPGGEKRIPGPDIMNLLLRFPNAVLWVNGHTHTNSVVAHPNPAGGSGFWEVSTASHIDWPQQSRLLEVVDNKDGSLSVFATLVDHAAPADAGRRTDDVLALASLARELAGNDWQGRGEAIDRRNGKLADRNVELLVRAPFSLDT